MIVLSVERHLLGCCTVAGRLKHRAICFGSSWYFCLVQTSKRHRLHFDWCWQSMYRTRSWTPSFIGQFHWHLFAQNSDLSYFIVLACKATGWPHQSPFDKQQLCLFFPSFRTAEVWSAFVDQCTPSLCAFRFYGNSMAAGADLAAVKVLCKNLQPTRESINQDLGPLPGRFEV